MRGQVMLYRDQYGNSFYARTVKELRAKVGGGRLSKMFVDKTDGSTRHVGYVIGQHWLSMFKLVELPA